MFRRLQGVSGTFKETFIAAAGQPAQPLSYKNGATFLLVISMCKLKKERYNRKEEKVLPKGVVQDSHDSTVQYIVTN
jgi:DNA recombination-dependent growth factor C